MKNLYDEIKILHDSMREEVIDSGVQPAQYDYPINTKVDEQEFYEFLKNFHLTVYADLIKVRNLRPKEFWHNLKYLFRQHTLIEQRLLRNEQRKVRIAWHAKYAPPLTDTDPQKSV